MPDNPTTRDAVLFPEIDPYQHGRLAVDSLHTLYWEACGRADGVPVVSPARRTRTAVACRTIAAISIPRSGASCCLDQRGAGRSTPIAEIEGNTTQALIDDLERLRVHLRIERWLVFGGSWGSTLALAYAQAHPPRCLGLVLRGIFLASAAGDRLVHARHAQRVSRGLARVRGVPARGRARRPARELLPAASSIPILPSTFPRRTRGIVTKQRARRCCPASRPSAKFDSDAAALAIARIEAHYFVHNAFLDEDALLADLARIRHLPCTIVQGRYDIVCPPVTADALARAWPEATYIVVADAGHSVREPGITRELVAAVERMKRSSRAERRGDQRVAKPPSSRTRSARDREIERRWRRRRNG